MKLSTPRALAVGLVAAIGATGAMSGLAAENPSAQGMVVVAEFDSAGPLLTRNEVKVDGVVVGEVGDIVVDGDHADVLLDLDPSALPLYQDATATIRPISLLGERYVDIERGTPGTATMATGGTIPRDRTGTNVDLDEILNTVDEPTGESLAFLVTTLGDGLRDNGGNVDAALKALAPALRDTEGLTAVLEDQNVLLGSLVDRVEPVAGALATDGGASLDRLVASADRLLAASSRQQEALDQTLAELPGALRSARTTLGELAGTAQETTPTLRTLRPVTEDLSEISGELRTFADSLDPALAQAEPVLQEARKLLEEAQPVAADLRTASPDLRTASADARPLVEDLTANLDNVLNFVRYWALTTNGYDGLSHYFRAHIIVNQDSATNFLPQAVPVPPLFGTPPLIGGEQPGSDVPGTPTSPPVGGSLLQAPGPDDDGATGLTPEQESGMLGSLLGGGS
ncbi:MULTISPECIES: MlaD family protein [Pseudonocardia]|uniref:MCE family protein n=1 Tax=Pseudonocardia abyssalis TaxID=2792008 RepID=A0ABS6V1Z8_9PSEU|nr:MlaD family protein [Pseudonocardia abyssalis]MBW0114658.1 MCE family protein [Pseudonocardia abyssalis]MBW0138281.1 MCE family protein [Pseudonocardia abyssalis]